MLIYLKSKLKPIGRKKVKIAVRETNKFRDFNVGNVQISFVPEEAELLVSMSINADEDLLNYYQDKKKILPRNPLLEQYRDKIQDIAMQVIKYLKYFYGISELDENFRLLGICEWSLNKIEWQQVPEKYDVRWLPGELMYTLDDNFLSWIPDLIERKIEPFFAFTHLHKAFAESNTRHQWINATIAAELAFKEFLSQFDSKATTLITQVPSPPLQKLYRDVLKDYTGEESPMHAKLGKGAERRNHLIHRTTEPSPTPKEALIYNCQVQVAIFHLYKKLHEDALFDFLLKRSEGYLKYIEDNADKLI